MSGEQSKSPANTAPSSFSGNAISHHEYHHEYNDQLFRQKIKKALQHVHMLVNPATPHLMPPPQSTSNDVANGKITKSASIQQKMNLRNPVFFSDYKNRTYEDQFGLADFLTNVAIASQMNVLDAFGVDDECFQWMHEVATTGAPLPPTANNNAQEPDIFASFRSQSSNRPNTPTPGKLKRRDSFSSVASITSIGKESINSSFRSNDQGGVEVKVPKKKSKYNRVIMRFVAEETCTFDREEKVPVDLANANSLRDLTECSGHGGDSHPEPSEDAPGGPPSTFSPYPRRKEKNPFFRKSAPRDKISEYHWKVSIDYSIQILATCLEDKDDGDTASKRLSKKSGATHHETNGQRNDKVRSSFRRDDQVYTPSSSFGQNESAEPPPPEPIILQSRMATTEIVTTASNTCPLPAETVRPPIDVDITWLFHHISSDDFNCNFRIDRNHANCITPRRNSDINSAMKYFADTAVWSDRVCSYFLKGAAWNVEQTFGANHRQSHNAMKESGGQSDRRVMSLESINASSIFVPVLPLLESPTSSANRRKGSGEAKEEGNEKSKTPPSPLLPIIDVRLFLNEQCRTLDDTIGDIVSKFPTASSKTKLVTAAEATLVLLACHSASITEYFMDGIQSLEKSTEDSLIKAVGENITEQNFMEFVQSHCDKFIMREFRPEPFSRMIRRPQRFPEGSITIQSVVNNKDSAIDDGWMAPVARNVWVAQEEKETKEGGTDECRPIMTLSKEMKDGGMEVPISNLTTVHLSGKSYVHGWLSHQFEGRQDCQHQLVAKARQFSSFVLVIGSMTSPQCLEPKDAIIVRNRDEVIVPLVLGMVPANGADEDMSSLSPEQLQFARSARETQLTSSIFGACVIEIRPQLEVLLGLPSNSLTKKVRLTERLVSLFVDHHIPTDMLLYDGPDDASTMEKIASVEENVANAEEMAKEFVVDDLHDHHDETVSAELTADVPEEVPAYRPSLNRRLSIDKNKRPSQFNLFPDMSSDQGGATSIQAEKTLSSEETKVSDSNQQKEVIDAANLLANKPAEEHHIDVSTRPKHKILSGPKKVPSIQCLESLNKEEDDSLIALHNKFHTNYFVCHGKDDSTKCLQPTLICSGDEWSKRSSSKPPISSRIDQKLGIPERTTQRRNAFDLLDALSCSGSLPIQFSETHAIVGVTHCFDKSLIETVVVDNVNPIEKLFKSTLLVGSTIHGVPIDIMSAQNDS